MTGVETVDARNEIIHRGGEDTERVYLDDLEFTLPDGRRVVVEESDFVGMDFGMEDVFARHKGRYSLLGLFCRPGQNVLDFPCGSGYAAEFLEPFGVNYHGLDHDPPTVEYARRMYPGRSFAVGDLCSPNLPESHFDVIGCIEGLEHIDQQFQSPLIAKLKSALKPNGVMVVSSPENPTGQSGPSIHNPHHPWELTKYDFLTLLHEHFPLSRVELVTQQAFLSTRVLSTCLYGVCRKEASPNL